MCGRSRTKRSIITIPTASIVYCPVPRIDTPVTAEGLIVVCNPIFYHLAFKIYRCTLHPQAIAAVTGIPPNQWSGKDGPDQYIPMFNLFPGCCLPVLYYEKSRPSKSSAQSTTTTITGTIDTTNSTTSANVSGTRSYPTVRPMRWGLVPSYHNAKEKPDFFRMFNARSETIGEKNVFKKLTSQQRCIILVDGFYEWKNLEDTDASLSSKMKKIPVYVRRNDGLPLLLAGLYDTCTIDRSLLFPGKIVEDKEETENSGTDNHTITDLPIQYNYTETIDDNVSLMDQGKTSLSTTSSSSSTASSSSSIPFLKSIPDTFTTTVPTVMEAVKIHAPSYPLITSITNPYNSPEDSSSLSTVVVPSKSSQKRKLDEEQFSPPSSTLSTMYTCTILTCSPSSELAWLHDRMPVILDENMAREWLNIDDINYDTLVRGFGSSSNQKHQQEQQVSFSPTFNGNAPKDISFSSLPFFHPSVHNLVWHTCHPRMNTVKYQNSNVTEFYRPKEDDFRILSSPSSSNRKKAYGLQSSVSLSPSTQKGGIQRNMMDFFKKSNVSPSTQTNPVEKNFSMTNASVTASTNAATATTISTVDSPSNSRNYPSKYENSFIHSETSVPKKAKTVPMIATGSNNKNNNNIIDLFDDEDTGTDPPKEKDNQNKETITMIKTTTNTALEEEDIIDLSHLNDAEGYDEKDD